MLENMQLWVFGTAALIDTVLLFALLERHNWRAVTIWMLLLAVGVWTWHVSYFVWQLVGQSVGPLADPMRWFSMLAMAFGLLMMPSAALHGTARLLRHGEFRTGALPDPKLILCYLPLLLLMPINSALAVDPTRPFLDLLVEYRLPYVGWLCLVSGVTAYGLWTTSMNAAYLPLRRFYRLLAASMVLTAGLTATFIVLLDRDRDPSVAILLQPFVSLLPMIPVILFAYFVMRFQLLPFVLERTLVYAAVLTGAMLFHQIVLQGLISSVGERYRLNLGVIEGALVFLAIMLYQPLRYRVAEALQSLLDSTGVRRNERQRLAVQLASRAGDPVIELLNWFVPAMKRSFGSDLGAAWLCDRDGRLIATAGSSELLRDENVAPILLSMAKADTQFVTRYSVSNPAIVEFLDLVRAGALLRFQHAEVSGLFLIGCRRWGQPPSNEDLHALALLVEQFGVTLHNSRLMAIQVAAEHRVLQQEKLSTLGLIASSLAHEIKNPLSTIKTITRVMAEELGPDSRYAEDLQMIGGEIERLTASASELLSAARPPRGEQPAIPLLEALNPTLRLLEFLAREREVEFQIRFPEESILMSIDHVNLREIVFNLISNAIDAAGPRGRVHFHCQREMQRLTLEVGDTGPGLSAEQQDRLFEPFFTTKSTGTGLGLYIVARRVRESGGLIDCRSVVGQGTTFVLTLPYS
ncbi:sensor histidine kinase [Schlesneria paludicola]|uniref:sensor histidine kinase n=1 Tax=Schlesneria paludicola TaxID=360056 RepID=UPI00029A57DC|nr:HAMP domain-containing sensor histidine kinase [Schlesneria paludicola]